MSLKPLIKLFLYTVLKIFILVLILGGLSLIPGRSTVACYGYTLELNTGVLIGGGILFSLFIHFLLTFYKWFCFLPTFYKKQSSQHRMQKAEFLTLKGYTHLLSGHFKDSLHTLEKAKKLGGNSPLITIFRAQAAYEGKNDPLSEEMFLDLLKERETCFLGYRGLALLKEKNSEETHSFLQKALKEIPSSPWALRKIFHWNVKHFEFSKAHKTLNQLQTQKFFSLSEGERKKALLYWMQAEKHLKQKEFYDFYKAVHRALKHAPELKEATLALATYYSKMHRQSKAWKCLKKGYMASPHSDFLGALKEIFPEQSPLEWYQKAQDLTQSHLEHPETHLILLCLALEAKVWGKAKYHLELLKGIHSFTFPFILLKQLEREEIRKSLNLEEEFFQNYPLNFPEWICHNCHYLLEKWSPSCPHCHSFDCIHDVIKR